MRPKATYTPSPGESLVAEMVRKHERPGRAGGAGFYAYPTEKGAKKFLWPQLKDLYEKSDVQWNINDLKSPVVPPSRRNRALPGGKR